VPSPVKKPEAVDMVLFRENCEDIYAGIEFKAGSVEAQEFAAKFQQMFPAQFKKVRFPGSSAYGIKPVSEEGAADLITTIRLWRCLMRQQAAHVCAGRPFATHWKTRGKV
jgi:isocitrate dehydrogenase